MQDTEARPSTSDTSGPRPDQANGNDDERVHRIGRRLAVVLVVVAAALVASTLLLDRKTYGVPIAAMLIVAAFLLVGAVAVPIVAEELQRARQQRLAWFRDESEALARIAGKNSPLGNLIAFNFRLMERFVGVAITQAQASFLACTVAATAGLLVLLVGAATVLTVHGLASQITVGALTTIGAAVGCYITVTFLNTFKMTSRQMSYYYGQPLVHCYLLHAEWLGNRFEHDPDPDHRWQIHQELIQAVLDASRNAQSHLLDLQIEAEKAAAPTTAGRGQ